MSRPRPVQQQQQERNNAAAAAGDRGKPGSGPALRGDRQEKPRLLHPWLPLRPRFVWLGLCPGSGGGGGSAPDPAGEGGADRPRPLGTGHPPEPPPRPRGRRAGEPPSPPGTPVPPRGERRAGPPRGAGGERPGGCGAGGGGGAGRLAAVPSPKWCPGAAAPGLAEAPRGRARRAAPAAQFGLRLQRRRGGRGPSAIDPPRPHRPRGPGAERGLGPPAPQPCPAGA